MTREQERRIKRDVRRVTAGLVAKALESGYYHRELHEMLHDPLLCGTEKALATAQACAEESATMSLRAERGR